jgi:hypothetical protein
VLLVPALLFADSLGAVAQKDQEKRKKQEASGAKVKTFSDQDLHDGGHPGQGTFSVATGTTPAPPSSTSPSSGVSSAGTTTRGQQGPSGDPKKARAAEYKTAMAEADRAVRVAEERLRFLGECNLPQELHEQGSSKKIDPCRPQTEAKATLERARQAFAQLEESARREGIPPAWLH